MSIELTEIPASVPAGPVPDWTVRDLPGASEAVTWAARRIAREFGGVVEFDDMVQEAEIALATQGEAVRELYRTTERPGAVLQHRLYCDLHNKVATTAKRLRKHQSYEAAIAAYNSEAC